MRRAAFLAVVSVLAGCSSPSGEVTVTGSLPPLAEAADSVAARAAVIRFLEAYEDAPIDGGASLAALAGSPAVQHWAVWLGVQFRQVDGRVTGDHTLGGIGRLQPLRAVNGTEAVITQLVGTVTFTITPPEGAPRPQTRSLDGPMVLAYDDEAGWRVADFTRDGIPLSNSVHVFPSGAGIRDRGVTIQVDSFILDRDHWALGVFVLNETARTIAVEPEFVGIYDVVAEPVDAGVTPTTVRSIAPGARVGALIAYPIPDGEAVSGLRLVLGARIPGDEQPVLLDVPVRPLLRGLERVGTVDPSSSPAATA